MAAERSAIAGSDHQLRTGEHIVGPAPPDQPITVTLYLRRSGNQPLPTAEELLAGRAQPLSREHAQSALTASPEDMNAVRGYLEGAGLRIVAADPASRRISASGYASQLNAAFDIRLHQAAMGAGPPYLTYTGAITLPSELAGIVTAVLGLDNRPVAAAH